MPYAPGFFRPGVNPGYANQTNGNGVPIDPQGFLRQTLGSLAPLPVVQQSPASPVTGAGGSTPPGGIGSMWGYLPGQKGQPGQSTGNIGTITGPVTAPSGSGSGSGLSQSFQDAIQHYTDLGGITGIFGPQSGSQSALDTSQLYGANGQQYPSQSFYQPGFDLSQQNGGQAWMNSLPGQNGSPSQLQQNPGLSNDPYLAYQQMQGMPGSMQSPFSLTNPLYGQSNGVDYSNPQQPQDESSQQQPSMWDRLLGNVGNHLSNMVQPTNLLNTGANLLLPGLGTGMSLAEKMLVQNATSNGNYDPAEHSAITNYLVSQSNTPLSSWNQDAASSMLNNRADSAMQNYGVDPGAYDWGGLDTSFLGGGGGADFGCVTLDTYLEDGRQAKDVTVGDWMPTINPVDDGATFFHKVTYAEHKIMPCVRITTDRGFVLECSTTAPISDLEGKQVLAPDLVGMQIPMVDASTGTLKPDIHTVVSVEPIGEQMIVHITCGNQWFLAGAVDGKFFYHHNMKQAPMGNSGILDWNNDGEDDYAQLYGES